MTTIEWTQRPGTKGETLNPIRARNKATGKRGWFCVHANGDCTNCYAERINVKGGDTGGNGIAYKAQLRDRADIYLDEETLLKPLHWRAARTIFVCSMTDLFGDWVPDEWIDKLFAVAALCPQHTFIVLTKRPKRMRAYMSVDGRIGSIRRSSGLLNWFVDSPVDLPFMAALWPTALPLPNVWLGTSCGTQDAADEFVPELLATPAAVRLVSVEPMRGPVDLTRIAERPDGDGVVSHYIDALTGEVFDDVNGTIDGVYEPGTPAPKLDWVICGGESGPKARPMHPDWARSLRDQCSAAGVPFFFKQWGEWLLGQEIRAPYKANDPSKGTVLDRIEFPDGDVMYGTSDHEDIVVSAAQDTKVPTKIWRDYWGTGDGRIGKRVGKKRAGRKLDGVEHNAFPDTVA